MHWGPRENKSRLFARLSVRVCVYVCVLPMCVHARVWKVKRLWHFRDPVRIFTQRRDVMAALERKKTAWANGSLQRIPSTQHHQEEERGCRRVYICLLVRFCAFKPDLRWKRFFWPPSIKLLEKKKKKRRFKLTGCFYHISGHAFNFCYCLLTQTQRVTTFHWRPPPAWTKTPQREIKRVADKHESL